MILRIVTVAPSATRTKSLESCPKTWHPTSPQASVSLSMTRSRVMNTPAWVQANGVVTFALSRIEPTVPSLTAASSAVPFDTSAASEAGTRARNTA